MAEKKISTLSSLRSLGRSINCVLTPNGDKHSLMDSSSILKSTKIDIDEADKLAEKIVDEVDFNSILFIAPINTNAVLLDKDDDGKADSYWTTAKPKIIEKISMLTGLRYGFDFALLRRGYFSILTIFTKNENGHYEISEEVFNKISPDGPEHFWNVIDLYYRNTDVVYVPMNVIVRKNPFEDVKSEDFTNPNKVYVKTINVDISFLRCVAFKEYDEEEGREHSTYAKFTEGIARAVAIEHDVVSFDDADIDALLAIQNK